MAYAEVNDAGEFVVDEEGNRNVIENLDFGGWDHVKEMIPEDLREEKVWETIPDTPTLLKNYAHSQKTISKTIRVPGENATVEEWGEIHSKLGRPDTTEGYSEIWGEMPEGMEWDPELQQVFMASALKAGLSPQGAKHIISDYENYMRGVGLELDRDRGTVEAELKERWGPNFELNSSLAHRAVTKLGGDPLHDVLDKSGLGNHPVVIDAMLRVGRMMAEDNIIPSSVEGVATGHQAQAKIDEIMADPKHAYHTGDKAAGEEMRKLHLLVHPPTA